MKSSCAESRRTVRGAHQPREAIRPRSPSPSLCDCPGDPPTASPDPRRGRVGRSVAAGSQIQEINGAGQTFRGQNRRTDKPAQPPRSFRRRERGRLAGTLADISDPRSTNRSCRPSPSHSSDSSLLASDSADRWFRMAFPPPRQQATRFVGSSVRRRPLSGSLRGVTCSTPRSDSVSSISQ